MQTGHRAERVIYLASASPTKSSGLCKVLSVHVPDAARGEGRAGKAAPLLRSDKQAKEGERQLRGARATAAARTRGHSAWGKRHVPKAGRDSFTPAAMPKSGTTALSLSAVTRVSPGPSPHAVQLLQEASTNCRVVLFAAF